MRSLSVDILRELVAFDTSNPPRRITTGGVFAYAKDQLTDAGFDVDITDLGDGHINLLAVRGKPNGLFNVHLDTIPADERWRHDPFELTIVDDRAIGLGACDIKGAAACLLAAAANSTGSAAILFTSDEEAGQSQCVPTFLEDVPEFVKYVVVAEPSLCQAVTAHRGLCTCEGVFMGVAAHGSLDAAEARSAVHNAAQWVHAALERAECARTMQYDGLQGLRLNVGVIEGGVKANVVASSARVVFGVRPLPVQSGPAVVEQLCGLAPRESFATWTPRFMAPPLAPSEQADQIVASLHLPHGSAVDFWTEAALFAQAGVPSFVFGPGDIQQAHTADEWIAIDQLEQAANTYQRLFSADNGS